MDEAELRDDDLHDKRMARLKREREEKEALKAGIEQLRAALNGIRLYCESHAMGGWRHDISSMVDAALTTTEGR